MNGANLFNLTKSAYVDLANDVDKGFEEPKLKGYFVCLMVKPDLNLLSPSYFNSAGPSATPDGENSYAPHMHQARLLKGLINETVYQNLVHNPFPLQISDIVANKCESISYPDIGNTSEDTALSLDKASFKLPVGETGSNGATFSMRFRENEALDCLRMMSAWHKYIQGVSKGYFRAKEMYVESKIIDYKASLYVLHLKPDFKTITMFSKYTGIYPTNIPISAFSEEISQIQDVTFDIEFSYDKFEWLNEDILKEINLLFDRTVGFPFLGQKIVIKQAPLITRIKGTPFYYVDFNGLHQRLSANQMEISSLPQSKLGAKFVKSNDKNRQHKIYFPAAHNLHMIDYNTDLSISLGMPYQKQTLKDRSNTKKFS